jgi:hypothetical protein
MSEREKSRKQCVEAATGLRIDHDDDPFAIWRDSEQDWCCPCGKWSKDCPHRLDGYTTPIDRLKAADGRPKR